jgi:hypothetical protein
VLKRRLPAYPRSLAARLDLDGKLTELLGDLGSALRGEFSAMSPSMIT